MRTIDLRYMRIIAHGIEVDALREALVGGSTLADVAEANGVDPQVVVDALLADVEAHLAEEVAEGELTQEEADERLAEAAERIADRVENGRPDHERPAVSGTRANASLRSRSSAVRSAALPAVSSTSAPA